MSGSLQENVPVRGVSLCSTMPVMASGKRASGWPEIST